MDRRRHPCGALLFGAALLTSGCGGGSGGGDGDGSAPPSPPLTYSGGACPPLVPGENTLLSAGLARRVLLILPEDPVGKPVVFGWHWLDGTPYELVFATGLANRSEVIAVAPFSTGDEPFQWHMRQGPASNPDLVLFDDTLACLEEQFQVDLNRIWSMGMSAGALWTAYLAQYRSDRLAAVSILSGGLPDPNLAPDYVTPASPIPVQLEWGGDGDVLRLPGFSFAYNAGDPEVFSFAVASQTFAARLRADGHFVLECVGDQGHTLPLDVSDVWWPFLRDHPRGVSPEPYLAGLPPDMSNLCSLP